MQYEVVPRFLVREEHYPYRELKLFSNQDDANAYAHLINNAFEKGKEQGEKEGRLKEQKEFPRTPLTSTP